MKNYTAKVIAILAGVMLVGLISCGPGKSETKAEEFTPPDHSDGAAASAADPIAVGEALVKASDCKTCHHITNKILGPSHTDVAKKYEFNDANVKYLAEKIIKGGTGVWGATAMTPHPTVSQDDAEKMAQYVLSLDGEKAH